MLAAQRPHLETRQGLLRGAVAIAMHARTDTGPAPVEAEIEGYAEAVRRRIRSDDSRARLAHLHEVLFDHAGFTGNTEHYYDPRNSYLPDVLETKRGIPITLSLLYALVADRVGVAAVGVNAPAHFLVEVRLSGERMLIDPFFGGQLLTRTEAFHRIAQLTGAHVPHTDELLPVATHRDWLLRMLRNLVNIFSHRGDADALAAMLEMQALLEEQEPRQSP